MEIMKPPEEYHVPPEEYALPESEYYGQKPVKKAKEDGSARLRRLLKMILLPAAAALGSASVLLGAFGLAPEGERSADAGETTVSETPAEGTPAPFETPFYTEEPTEEPTPEPTPVPTPEPGGDWDDAFPKLDNMVPDFAGNYAWSGDGSEEYVRIIETGNSDYTFLEMGGVWGTMTGEDGRPYSVKPIDGAEYDMTTNTLTLTNFTGEAIDVNLMGNGFTIRLEGENHLQNITVWGAMYGGSLTITGPGSLTVDAGENGAALVLNAEASGSCIMIDRDATVELYGACAIFVGDTTLEKGLWYLMPIDMTGGSMALAGEAEDGSYRSFISVDENGEPAKHVSFRPRWTEAE